MKTCSTLLILFFLTLSVKAQTTADSGAAPKVETVSQPKVKVFPNPATSVVNILGLKNTSKATILIFDIYGNTVLRHQWEIRRNAINIPVAALPTGAYIITVKSDEQQVRTKFYKQ